MHILLDVPLVAQASTNTCWNAAAQMLWEYRQLKTGMYGPMNSISSKYSQNKTLKAQDFRALAKSVGLKKIRIHTRMHSSGEFGHLLERFGPLWCAGRWDYSEHIIVLTGIDGHIVYYNDPAYGGHKKSNTLHWFDVGLDTDVDGCLMYLDLRA
jgi:hypothetical protein